MEKDIYTRKSDLNTHTTRRVCQEEGVLLQKRDPYTLKKDLKTIKRDQYTHTQFDALAHGIPQKGMLTQGGEDT